MRFVLRLSLVIFGLCSILIAAIHIRLRQEPSTAYWILGEKRKDEDRSLYLTSPNNAVSRRVVSGNWDNYALPVDWLPDGHSFLYQWKTDDDVDQVRRYTLDTQTDAFMGETISFQFGEQLRLRTIPNRDDESLLLHSAEGHSIFTVSPDGEKLHQITPFHDVIFSMAWSADGEWLVYVATDELISTHDPEAASSVIYRQRFDGSERTQLWHLDDTMALLNLANVADDTFWVSFAPIGSSDTDSPPDLDLPIYRITTTEDSLTPITPADRFFTFFDYPIIEDWLIIYDYDISDASNQIYRMKANGEDFAPLLTLEMDVDRVIPYTAISSDELLIVVVQNNKNLMYRVNLETLEHERIILDYEFNYSLRSWFLSRNQQYLFIIENSNSNHDYFRYNIPENSYELLASRSNLNGSSQWIAHVFDTTALDIEVFGNTQNNRTEVYLFDQITGDHQLLTSFATSATPIFTDLPTDGEEVIMSITETFTLGGTTRQARINGVTGAMTPVNFGINMRFSPFIDSDWNGIALVVVGGGLLALLFGWRIIESRYDDAKTLRTEVLRYK